LGTIAAMELFSWFMHKYIMHGPLWFLHKSHHVHGESFFEWNDVFPVFFASASVTLMALGWAELDYRFWIGLGITLYGMIYFLIHDIIVHRRVKWFNNPKSGYFKALIRAHKMHHKHLQRRGGESFGLLWIARKYFKE
jgi:beta-carotene 3-hydroxylase